MMSGRHGRTLVDGGDRLNALDPASFAHASGFAVKWRIEEHARR
jgi:hypothetical protein